MLCIKENKMKINLGFVKFNISIEDSKFSLIENWKLWWRFWSIRFGILGAFVVSFPDVMIQTWTTLPDHVRDIIPEQYIPHIGTGLLVLSLVSRIIKQEKLKPIAKGEPVETEVVSQE